MTSRLRESRIFGGTTPRVQRAAEEWDRLLTEANIPHALMGGLAASAWSEPRATRDADFLVPASARSQLGGRPLGGEAYGVTVMYEGVRVDLLFPERGEEFLEDAIAVAPTIEGHRVLPPEALIFTKMGTGRARDANDIMNIISAGVDTAKVRRYLSEHAPDMVKDFNQIVAEVEAGGLK